MKMLLTQVELDPHHIDEVIMGCVGQPADSANIARVIALRAGIPQEVPAVTVHRNCASGMESITSAMDRIRAKRGDLYLVGGVESMSQYPLLYRPQAAHKFEALMRSKSFMQKWNAMTSFRAKDFSPLISLKLGLTDPVSGLNMGETAEILAQDYQISREEQDAFANHSHHKAVSFQELRHQEISPLLHEGSPIKKDNGVRTNSSIEKLSALRPIFAKSAGTVTAGNSSQVTDGAVALLVGSEEAGKKYGLTPIGRLIDYAYTGCDPKRMGLGPVKAIQAVNKRTHYGIEDASVIEINEAFAAQALACCKAISDPHFAKKAGLEAPLGELSASNINAWGGGIALGHPVGATGARLVQTVLEQLKDQPGKKGIASLCVGGGQGAALWIERL